MLAELPCDDDDGSTYVRIAADSYYGTPDGWVHNRSMLQAHLLRAACDEATPRVEAIVEIRPCLSVYHTRLYTTLVCIPHSSVYHTRLHISAFFEKGFH